MSTLTAKPVYSAGMTTTMITRLCDGQCGGEITLTISPEGKATAEVLPDPTTAFYSPPRDCDAVEVTESGIEVQCAAAASKSGDVCNGVVRFPAHAVRA